MHIKTPRQENVGLGPSPVLCQAKTSERTGLKLVLSSKQEGPATLRPVWWRRGHHNGTLRAWAGLIHSKVPMSIDLTGTLVGVQEREGVQCT